ncbi:MAG TPA: sensor domain-containing diguanylate cyclase, partial [Chloroflexota bacterium]
MSGDRALLNGRDSSPSPIHSAFTTGAHLLHAGRASLLLRHSTEPVLIVAAAIGIDSSVVPTIRVPIGQGIAGIVVERGISLFGAAGDQTFMSAPVATERGIEGALNLTDRMGGRQYSADDMDSATSIATHIGNLIQYSRHAAHDLVSGLPNRRAFEEVLEREIALSRRTGSSFAVVFMDLDNLKHINDTYGHGRGDEVIRTVGDALLRILRPYDFAGRHGGDEFALLLSGAGETDGGITSRILDALAHMSDSLHVPVSASIGVSRCPADGITAAQLVAAADKRMYENKRTK